MPVEKRLQKKPSRKGAYRGAIYKAYIQRNYYEQTITQRQGYDGYHWHSIPIPMHTLPYWNTIWNLKYFYSHWEGRWNLFTNFSFGKLDPPPLNAQKPTGLLTRGTTRTGEI